MRLPSLWESIRPRRWERAQERIPSGIISDESRLRCDVTLWSYGELPRCAIYAPR
jgi:hypothetical protein